MRQSKKQVEKLEDDRKRKRIAAQKKKEDDRKKTDVRQAKNNRSVWEMMKHWKAVEDDRKAAAEKPPSTPLGKILQTKNSGRKTREEEPVSKKQEARTSGLRITEIRKHP